jgi:hypothetical protein
MAKMKWELKGNLLGCVSGDVEMGLFDMTELYTDGIWDKMDQVAKDNSAYGTKQKLSDSIARNADEKLNTSEKIIVFKSTWKQLTEDRMFNKKAAPLTPMQKAERALTKVENEIAEMMEASKKTGVPEEMAQGLAEKLYGEKLAQAKEMVSKLSGKPETKLRKNGK